MTSPRTRHAIVQLAALDLRRSPDHRSELLSQLLLGERVRVTRGSRDGRWVLVAGAADGYAGWARAWGLVEVSGPRADAWERRARSSVTRNFAEIREGPGRGPLLTPVFWRSRLIAGGRQGRFRRVELPDGRRGWLPQAALGRSRGSVRLVERIRSLLGVPYLWGGRTPGGVDCSGLIQLLLAEQGLSVPRDAHEQHRQAEPLGRTEEAREGDLVFFGPRRGRVAHVGLCLGAGYFVHARGRVCIGSYESGNPLYDKMLNNQWRGLRRPGGRRRKPAARGREIPT